LAVSVTEFPEDTVLELAYASVEVAALITLYEAVVAGPGL
jgi:hypothetical protein